MISKLIHSDDHEQLFRDNSGIMQSLIDYDARVKSASSEVITKEILNRFKPDKDHVAVHMIMLGDEEHFGFNKNSDSFPKLACQTYFNTFVTHGHMFREHRHKSPELKIGDIKYAAYNEKQGRIETLGWYNRHKAEDICESIKSGASRTFSMSCFTAGHKVRMSNGCDKNIEDIVEGDSVLTHRGNVGIVSHTQKHESNGDGVRFRPYGLPDDITCTADHGIWVRQKASHITECPVCGQHTANMGNHVANKRDPQHKAARGNLPKLSEGFLRADFILPGDFIRQAIDSRVAEAGSLTWAVVAGYYLAEGSLAVVDKYNTIKGKKYGPYPDHRIEFCFNENETDFIREVSDAIAALGFPRPSSFHYPKEHRTIVRSHNRELHAWLLEHCGKYSHEKRLSNTLMRWAPATQKVILDKWMEGDGTWHKKNQQASATTVSRTLAWQMLEIAGRCRIVGNLGAYQPKQKNKKRAYVLSFTGENITGLGFSKVASSWQPVAPARQSTSQLKHQVEGSVSALHIPGGHALSFVEGNFIYRRIRKAERILIQELVYDLTVPGDHGFVVNGVGVSNCRVPGDVCTCHDHFAKSPADYCDNMKERPGQYISRMQKYASVRNHHPTFFDASDVKNNADRTAMYLSYRFGDDEMQKAASTKAGLVVPGFEWAKLAGVDFTETPDYGKYQQLAQQLAAEETWVSGALKEATITGGIKHAFLRHAVPNMLSQEMSQQELDTVRALRPVTFFGRLAKTASILPPKTFFAYTFNRPIAEVEQDENVKAACCMLPGIFRRMLTTPNGMIENDIDAFDAGDGSISIDPGMTDPVAQVMSNADGKFSCEDQNLKGRTIHIIQIKLASGSDAQRDDAANAMWKNANTEAASYALLYGAYKMAALRGIENHRPDIYDERKVFLAAAHNFFV